MRLIYPDKGLASLCRLFGKTRQGWYHWHQSKTSRALLETIVVKLVKDIRDHIGIQKLGARKLQPLINEQLVKNDLRIGRDYLFDVMERNSLKVRQRKRRRPQTTDSTHGFIRYPNLVKGLEIKRAEQVWVVDITYLKVGGRFMYLSLITDAYSRKIMGYCLLDNLSVDGPMRALLMSFSNRLYVKSLIHHSDQGVQYCSQEYVNMLKTHGVSISMTHRGSPQENAIAERVNGILKDDYNLGKSFETPEQAEEAVQKAVASYNCLRPHDSLNGMTPEQVHTAKAMEESVSSDRTIRKGVKSRQD
ncbi:MAG: IS3 family transposase [Cyclobacteriaceae bacterium]|jgi:transposase InsO family protein